MTTPPEFPLSAHDEQFLADKIQKVMPQAAFTLRRHCEALRRAPPSVRRALDVAHDVLRENGIAIPAVPRLRGIS